ncbi:aminotransferase class III-fold pyridoxal phosphate-dependent enzyme [Streptantibioticus ferralitis]|uniref:Aminotransferase class III-fold pyridoxal phosphate-dependent enzyme n=1 Tax=Streptantibioticus ferralitis TaxID=236510 RepID=A0ABT5Z775_9ACTN|nr:aminotransferase class III-fold pyridoxal phosphate-dependent enzyme [Streptantibioticus ferralitis]MDF2259688.1 aminotransferase class III-fold pyridoxal phosphate-dependent enzyme [Streptantibioticus ferralitis]
MDRYVARRNRLLTSSRPLPDFDVVAASGPWLHCADGRKLFDGSSGLICVNVGQGSPAVFSRIEEQFHSASFAGAAVVRPHVQMELMDRLCHAVGRPQDSVALVTCGTLGVEVAVQLARNIARVRGEKRRGDILTSNLSYHGMSALTLALGGNGARRPRPEDAFGLGPAFPAPYPPVHDHAERACDASCADEVAKAIDTRGAQNVAAVLLEPVNGTTGGAYVPPDGYLRRVSQICRERNVLVIHDEVLTGLWRTGTPLASNHWDGAEPDLCILSKGLGAGYTSVAAVLVSAEIAPLLRHEDADPLPAMGTMAAHPLQAAACLGVLDELDSMDTDAFQARGERLGALLRTLTDRSCVRDVRGLGHLYAVELAPGLLWPLMEEAEKRGVFFYPFTGAGAPRSEGLVVAPPLISTDEDIDFMAAALRDAVTALDPNG